jgi:hypothetical protein
VVPGATAHAALRRKYLRVVQRLSVRVIVSAFGLGYLGNWHLSAGGQSLEVVLQRRLRPQDEKRQVPWNSVRWYLGHWLIVARGTLLEMYAALGEQVPRGLTSLEWQQQERGIRARLDRAFGLGELVALRQEEPAWAWGKLVSPGPGAVLIAAHMPRSARAVEKAEALFPEPARQAQILQRAATLGIPFCEQCEKSRLGVQESVA